MAFKFNASSVTTAITGASGQNVITVASNLSLVVGMSVTGTGIGTGATITSINGVQVVLSVANTATVSGNGVFSGTTINVYPGVLPTPSSADVGSPMYTDGANMFFSYPGATSTTVGTGWRYRTILTHGFLAAGYKGYNAWKSVNKTWHATDTTYYCGEQIDRAGAYVDGSFSDYNGYVYGTSDTWQGSSAHVSSINLHNGALRMVGPGLNSSTASNFSYNDGQGNTADLGGWNLPFAIAVGGAATNSIGQVGYSIGGGSATVRKLNMTTEIMYTTSISMTSGQSAAGWGGQLRAYVSPGYQTLTFSNDSVAAWSAGSTYGVADGQDKTLGSKWDFAYSGYSTNTASLNIGKFSDITGNHISYLTKLRNYGEGNNEMGQDWGYLLGQYDGQQNNHTVKTNYATDTMTQLGAAAMPKGHVGQSSGACFSAAASITSAAAL